MSHQADNISAGTQVVSKANSNILECLEVRDEMVETLRVVSQPRSV